MKQKQFFIVGAQRSGTTYLYNILDEHPEICMAKPVKPEPKYFLNKNYEEINLIEYYKRYYNSNSSTKVFGEKSTSYYENEKIAEILSNSFSNIKIIFCLRNPVKRALSNYQFSVDNKLETRSLEEVFINNKSLELKYNTSVNPFNYLGRGEYINFIKIYKKYFDESQIKVLIFEDLIGNENEIKRLYDFLEVDSTFMPLNINKIINASSQKKEVSNDVIMKIKDYFIPYNKELSKLINNELLQWK